MDKTFWKGLIVGTILGTIAGVLLNSNKGRKMREQVKNKIADELSHFRDISKEKYRDLVEKTVQAYSRTEKMSKEEADELKSELEEKFDRIKDVLK